MPESEVSGTFGIEISEIGEVGEGRWPRRGCSTPRTG
jgi:hypothetical protein